MLYNIGIDSFVDAKRGANIQQKFFVRNDLEDLGLKHNFLQITSLL